MQLATDAGAQTPQELDAALSEIDGLTVAGDLPAAVELGQALLERVEQSHGARSVEAGQVLTAIGLAHCVGRREIDRGLELSARAVELTRAALGIEAREAQRALGWCQYRAGHYEQARETMLRALAAPDGDPSDPGLSAADSSTRAPSDALEARIRVELALIEYSLGDLREARELVEESVRAAETASPPMERVLRGARNVLGIVSWELGDLETAAEQFHLLLEEALATLGSDHVDVAMFSNNLGLVLQDLGRWTEARARYEQAAAIARARESAGEATYLNNLGNLAQDLGDWSAAAEAYQRALDLYDASVGPDHPDVARTLTNFGNLLRVTGELDRAERQYRRALEIREQAFGRDHPNLAYTLINLGHLERRRRRWQQAAKLYERTLAIRTQAFGEQAPIVAQTLHERARLRLLEGRPDQALADTRRSLEIREQALGVDHHAVAETLADLAISALLAGDEELAAESASRAEDIGQRHYRLTARRLSEREALGLSIQRVGGLDLLLSLAAREGSGRRVERAFEAVLQSRNVVLEELTIRHEALREATPEIAARFAELQKASDRLARLMTSGVSAEQSGDEAGEIARVRALVDRLEREVAEGSETLRRARRRSSPDEVLGGLPADAALVSLVRYEDLATGPLSEGKGEGLRGPSSYVALVSGAQGLRAVALGAARPIDLAVEQWRRQVRAPASGSAGASAWEGEYRVAGAALRRLLWDPLVEIIGAAGRVFVVPDGDLHLVNLATLPAPDGGYLAEAGPRFHTLVAESDLLQHRPSDPAGGLLVVGAPDFEIAMEADGAPAVPEDESSAEPALRGGPIQSCPSLAGTRFEAIPGTGEEVRIIDALWQSRRERAPSTEDRASARVLTGSAATESAVKSLAGGRRIVHLATHGFSLGADCRLAGSGVRGVGGLAPAPRRRLEGPLSGLVLAGAHRALGDAEAQGEDGLLTSLEIGGLDLRAAEWVVLSACETGVGPTVDGEGVLAMHRAFLAAGARTVITSLWAVEDSAAREWMEHLYRARLSEGSSTADAVHAATVRSLAQRRAQGETTHPFYWGSFVAIGDWR